MLSCRPWNERVCWRGGKIGQVNRCDRWMRRACFPQFVREISPSSASSSLARQTPSRLALKKGGSVALTCQYCRWGETFEATQAICGEGVGESGEWVKKCWCLSVCFQPPVYILLCLSVASVFISACACLSVHFTLSDLRHAFVVYKKNYELSRPRWGTGVMSTSNIY